jgi:hypothetical protein
MVSSFFAKLRSKSAGDECAVHNGTAVCVDCVAACRAMYPTGASSVWQSMPCSGPRTGSRPLLADSHFWRGASCWRPCVQRHRVCRPPATATHSAAPCVGDTIVEGCIHFGEVRRQSSPEPDLRSSNNSEPRAANCFECLTVHLPGGGSMSLSSKAVCLVSINSMPASQALPLALSWSIRTAIPASSTGNATPPSCAEAAMAGCKWHCVESHCAISRKNLGQLRNVDRIKIEVGKMPGYYALHQRMRQKSTGEMAT